MIAPSILLTVVTSMYLLISPIPLTDTIHHEYNFIHVHFNIDQSISISLFSDIKRRDLK